MQKVKHNKVGLLSIHTFDANIHDDLVIHELRVTDLLVKQKVIDHGSRRMVKILVVLVFWCVLLGSALRFNLLQKSGVLQVVVSLCLRSNYIVLNLGSLEQFEQRGYKSHSLKDV